MSFGNGERRLLNQERETRTMDKIADTLLPLYAECSKRLRDAAIKRSSFAGFYNAKTMNTHTAYVRYCETQFAETNRKNPSTEDHLGAEDTKKISDVLEYFVYSGINNGRWIPFTKAIKTADYDDYKYKIDFVLEFISKATVGHIGIGIDVTFANDIKKKVNLIKEEIDTYDGKDNKLGRVTYYESEESGMRGELTGLPHVVLAIDIDVLDDLVHSKDQKNHIIRHIIITEIIEQLHIYASYAQKVNPACVPNFTRALRLMTVIQDELRSEQTLEESEYIKNRKMNERLSRELEIFSRHKK
jgi:hypothetical protein